jgi:glycine/serine hydroxymethyltransferase
LLVIFLKILSRHLPDVAAAATVVLNNTAKTVFPEYYHQIKKNEMNGACSTYGGEEKCM